jgi:hypothetical protein
MPGANSEGRVQDEMEFESLLRLAAFSEAFEPYGVTQEQLKMSGITPERRKNPRVKKSRRSQ